MLGVEPGRRNTHEGVERGHRDFPRCVKPETEGTLGDDDNV